MACTLTYSDDRRRFECLTAGPQDRHAPKAAGFRWDKEATVWWTTRDASAVALYDVADAATRARLDAAREEREKALVASRAADAAVEIPKPAGLDADYLPYQRAGVAYALDAFAAGRDVIIGDEMGLGKTIQALGVANVVGAKRILIVCPASLRINWAREARKWLVEECDVRIADGKRVETWQPRRSLSFAPVQVLIVNYDVLAKHEARLHEKTWDLVVADEAHYLKNPKTKRARSVFGWREKLRGGKYRTHPAIPAARRMFLTGTPISNRPIEAWPLLHAADPKTFGNWNAYAHRYCGATHNGWGLDVRGATNLAELQDLMRSTVMIRRTKREVRSDLPPKIRQVIEVPDVGGVAEREARAFSARRDAVARLRAAVELAKASDDPADYRKAVDALKAGVSAAFAEMSILRRETAVAKLPAVIEHIRSALDSGAKVGVFGHHREVVLAIADEFREEAGAVHVLGGQSQEERQAAVDRFQTDPACRLFVGNIQAAGVGLTLTASAHAIFAELDWVPGNVSQAEDRFHRHGQEAETVLVQHLVMEGSIDATIARAMVTKQTNIDAALDDDTDCSGMFGEPIEVPEVAEPPTTAAVRPERIAREAASLSADQIAAAHAALRIVASACDGAEALDGMGFNKADSLIGKSLAERPTLTPKQAALAARLAVKYQRQIPEELVARVKAAGK